MNMALFIILSLFFSWNSDKIVQYNVRDNKVLEESNMYLMWQNGDSRDSTFQGEFSQNKYSKTGYIKSLSSIQGLSRYLEKDKDKFRFLFKDPSRFRGYKNKVSAIIFQGTPAQKKILDEIRYITLDDKFDVHTSAGIMPLYEGGYQGMIDYFNKRLNSAKNPNTSESISGNVILGFIVDKDGKIGEIRILDSSHEQLDKKAYELVKSMPKWKPAMNGYPVPVFLVIQLIFFTD